jgi:hypothetical protein
LSGLGSLVRRRLVEREFELVKGRSGERWVINDRLRLVEFRHIVVVRLKRTLGAESNDSRAGRTLSTRTFRHLGWL